jgi:outer membrane usher protein FimD/PapC
VLAFVGLFVYIFGLHIKGTNAYACSLGEARRSPVVITALGEPLEAGFFAWSSNYSQEGSVTDASFRTALEGPKGKGTLRVRWYNSPVGSSLHMELEKDGQTRAVYGGTIPCR